MNFVENFNFYGVDARQIPCIKGNGAPTEETEGAVGCLYMDTTNSDIYKCVADTKTLYIKGDLITKSGEKWGVLVDYDFNEVTTTGETVRGFEDFETQETGYCCNVAGTMDYYYVNTEIVSGYYTWVDITEDVNAKIGDIETALDSIIAIQESLIGGKTADTIEIENGGTILSDYPLPSGQVSISFDTTEGVISHIDVINGNTGTSVGIVAFEKNGNHYEGSAEVPSGGYYPYYLSMVSESDNAVITNLVISSEGES